MQVYRGFGLGSSYVGAMNFDCLLRYSEYDANDRNFPDVPTRLLGNIYQVPIEMISFAARAWTQVLPSVIICLFF